VAIAQQLDRGGGANDAAADHDDMRHYAVRRTR
jgi:hypothetical protein